MEKLNQKINEYFTENVKHIFGEFKFTTDTKNGFIVKIKGHKSIKLSINSVQIYKESEILADISSEQFNIGIMNTSLQEFYQSVEFWKMLYFAKN
jgi:hypothetical protein